jgi:hypothetical protein
MPPGFRPIHGRQVAAIGVGIGARFESGEFGCIQ